MNLPRTSFAAALLAATAFTLATTVDPWAASLRVDRSGSLFQLLLGDGRRLFANHFFAKADAYFHRGVYPSIFDPPRQEEMHMVSEGSSASAPEDDDHHEHSETEPHDESTSTDPSHHDAPARDWIERLNQHLNPTTHAHLEGGDTREMLPWLRLAAELDPHNPQNYTVPAYWLRQRLQRVDEAEQFLREGLRQNPKSPEILLELAILTQENRRDPDRASHLFEAALQHWQQLAPSADPNEDAARQALGAAILVRLAKVEQDAGRYDRALEHLRELRPLSPDPTAIDTLMEDVRAAMNAAPAPASTNR